MSQPIQIADQITVGANEGEATTDATNTESYTKAAITIEGDANTKNLDFELYGKAHSRAKLGPVDNTDVLGEDITNTENGSKTYLIDVSGLITTQVKLFNNWDTDTNLDVYINTTEHE